jgi:hypothetical protein
MKDINGYYIIKNNPTVKVSLKPQKTISLVWRDIIELVLPECNEVNCYNNKLTELIIPHGCKRVDCSNNNLKELFIPHSCKDIICYSNDLVNLTISNGCEFVNCDHNNLTKLILPESCTDVYCGFNMLHPQIKNLLESKNSIKIQLANNLQLSTK